MIGKWIRFRTFCVWSVQRVQTLALKTCCVWKRSKDGIFTVKSSFKALEGDNQQVVPVRMLWIPTTVSFFTQEIWRGKVLTSTQLQKRGYTPASMCPLCGKAKETTEHLCIHCPLIWRFWTALFSALVAGWTFSFERLKSSFLISFFLWASASLDLNDSFVRIFCTIFLVIKGW